MPQADVLGHARDVVCHGGSGTMLGALASGVPLVVTPLFADQPYNARRVAAVGPASSSSPATAALSEAVHPAALRDAIATVLTDDVFARSARGISAEVHRMAPVDAALTVLEAIK